MKSIANVYTYTFLSSVVPVPSVVGSFEYTIFTSFEFSIATAASSFTFALYVIVISFPILSVNFANSSGVNVIVNVVSPVVSSVDDSTVYWVIVFPFSSSTVARYLSPPISTRIDFSSSVKPFDNLSTTVNVNVLYGATFGTFEDTVNLTSSPTPAVCLSAVFVT